MTIGKNVKNIPAYLFYPYFSYSPEIASVVFEEGSVCESIGSYAFYHCSSLTSVTIGESVTSIGEYAFYNCTAITEINYNATNCADLSSSNNVFYNAGKSGDGIKVTIGKNVKNIPACLFDPYTSSYSPKITSVVFEKGSVCESIGKYAFAYCSRLTSITIPDGVTTIDDYAFASCSSLTSITITDNVTTIGNYAFSGCSSLTSVTIPDNVTTIGSSMFASCTALEYNEYDNAYYLGNTDNPYLVLIKAKDTSITSCDINKNTKFIYNSAFSDCSSLTSITIPKNVTNIGNRAFSGCMELTSITIPEKVTTIGDYAFFVCNALTEINYNATNCSDLSSSTFYKVGQSGDGIKVTIGKNVKNIPAYLFYSSDSSYSPKITSVVFEQDSVCESIGNYAFYDCSTLSNITIPDSVTTIGRGAFYNCTALQYNEYDNAYYFGSKNNPYLILMKVKDTSITSCVINENTKCIQNSAFNSCSNLTSITVSENVTNIGYNAFYNCSKLTSVNYNGTIDQWVQIDFDGYYSNPLYYAKNLYINKNLLTEANITTATKINDYAFYYCKSITSLTIGESVTNIGKYAFYGCTSLTSIIIPDSVTTIGYDAFDGCTSLTNVTIPNSVTSIGNSAFSGCKAF